MCINLKIYNKMVFIYFYIFISLANINKLKLIKNMNKKRNFFLFIFINFKHWITSKNNISFTTFEFHFKDWKHSTRILLTYDIFFSANFDSLTNLYPWNCFKSKNYEKFDHILFTLEILFIGFCNFVNSYSYSYFKLFL